MLYGGIEAFKAKKRLESFNKNILASGFTITHKLPSIYVDATKRKMVIFDAKSNTNEILHWTIDFKDILGTSVIKDGNQLISTSTGSLLGRALVGGVVLGGLGAILGGLTAKSKSDSQVKKLILEVILNIPSLPIHRITYLDSSGLSPDSLQVRTAVEKMEFAHAILELAIMGEDIPKAHSSQELQDTLRMLQLRAKRTDLL